MRRNDWNRSSQCVPRRLLQLLLASLASTNATTNTRSTSFHSFIRRRQQLLTTASSSTSGASTTLPSSSPSSFFKAPTTSSESSSAPSQTSHPSESSSPSSLPSLLPTVAPSSSMHPTLSSSPSLEPSLAPTQLPSLMPSVVASNQPSSFPSSSPTLECHDVRTFRSINNLTCAHHSGTDCTAWRYVLGGNLTALSDLIVHCPVSCGIDCGTFALQDVTLSFIISGLTGLLDVKTQLPLEEVALDYLVGFVDSHKTRGTFVLETVLLKSQEPIVEEQRILRTLQQQPDQLLQLRIALSLIGFTIALDAQELTEMLVAGVDSDGFTKELQASSEFFSEAQASSAVREFPQVLEQTNNDSNPASPPVSSAIIITVSILCVIGGVAAGFAIFILYKRTRTNQEGDSPRSNQSGDPSFFSFSRASSTPKAEGQFHFGAILGSLSRSQDSQSSIQTEKRRTSPTNVPEEDQVMMDQVTCHPLSGVIPPMIVINIDDEERVISPNNNNRPAIFPTRRVVASEDFLQALRTSDPAMMTSFSTRFANETYVQRKATLVREDEASVSSTPAKIQEADEKSKPHVKRSSSGGDMDDVQQYIKAFADLLRSTMTSPDMTVPKSRLPRGGTSPVLRNKYPPSSSRKVATTRQIFTDLDDDGMGKPVSRSLNSSPANPPPLSQARSITESFSLEGTQSLQVAKTKSRESDHLPELKYNFEAPSMMKLGLTIETVLGEEGTRIHAVKDYSPLYGQVFAGDKIVAIDAVDTRKLDSSRVSNILRQKRKKKSGIIILTVARPSQTSSISATHSRVPKLRRSHSAGNLSARFLGTS